MTSADLCRERGWGPGTRLAMVQSSGHPVVIILTAVGRSEILAYAPSDRSRGIGGSGEAIWPLTDDDWRVIADVSDYPPDDMDIVDQLTHHAEGLTGHTGHILGLAAAEITRLREEIARLRSPDLRTVLAFEAGQADAQAEIARLREAMADVEK